ncbi:MAG: glutamate synthase [Terriglobia bacterium]|nr:MAG: glutamate synthase [Terriglobia bacterium]
MADLVPIPLPLLLRRMFAEYQHEAKIFDLPKSKFFRGLPGLDLSVLFHGHRAATPLGPAAGPHGQLAQNIVLSWLGGSRIIELKTVQILDELKIPRPCIDAANVGYNVEWSQELKLEDSLREYVKAAMLLEVLKVSQLLGPDVPAATVFDMSAGYNLEGMRSGRVRAWIESMKDAAAIIDELRCGLPALFRDLPFPTRISDTISLSTFHGCPAGEIEGIVTFLLREMDCHVTVKLNPTLLGKPEVEHLLYEVLGYREIQLHPPAFENDLQFDEAIDLIPRLQRLAKAHGKHLSVKFCNTLVVKNHKGVFADELMYLSGPPLHPIALTLARKFRDRVDVPMSFSGGLDAHNVAAIVGMGFVPATTCTDLLRPGGYGRLLRYLENLGAEMRALGVTNVPDFVRRYRGTDNFSRYTWQRNQGVPRKIGSRLSLYDCITCDKCIPVCPNDANFTYDSEPRTIEYDNFELLPDRIRRVPGGTLRVVQARQFVNFADACNDCGNCDIFCPEAGAPNIAKARFFSSLDTYRKHAGANGFFIDWKSRTIYGTLEGESYLLAFGPETARFTTEFGVVDIRLSDHEVVGYTLPLAAGPQRVDLLPYLKLRLLYESFFSTRHANFVNAPLLPDTTYANHINN